MDRLQNLNDDFAATSRKKKDLENQIDQCTRKLKRSDKLIGQFHSFLAHTNIINVFFSCFNSMIWWKIEVNRCKSVSIEQAEGKAMVNSVKPLHFAAILVQ